MKKSEKIAKINNELIVAIAAEKAKRAKSEADYYARVHQLQQEAQEDREKATDDPDEPNDGDQPTVWLNGEQWTCAVVARRIIRKLPKLNYPKESFYIEISPSYFGGCDLSFRYVNTITNGVTSCDLHPKDEPEVQAAKVDLWLKKMDVEIANMQEIMRNEERKEADNE